MTEIKSTLDLVMEKTRHLTLTDEERREQERQQMQAQVRGLVRKYQDTFITSEQFVSAWVTAKEENRSYDDDFLAREIAGRCDVEGEHEQWLRLLVDLYGVDTGRLKTVFQKYGNAFASLAGERLTSLTSDLAAKGVNGSAVVPNLEKDPVWAADSEAVRAEFRGVLAGEISRLIRDVIPPR